MATLYTHAVAGLGIAQLYTPQRRTWLYWTLAAVLPVLPDCDVFSIAAYGTILGHRGFTHSLLFAFWLAFLAASLTFRALRANLWALTAVFFAALASHGILDALTKGGENIPFFWPAMATRYGNWGPIPVSDLGFEPPDPRRSRALRSELLWIWLPTTVWIVGMILYRLARRRRAPTATNDKS
jgi:inner membrane protein